MNFADSVVDDRMSLLGDLQSGLTQHQLQLSQVQAEESRCSQSIAALEDERVLVQWPAAILGGAT